MIFTLIDSLRPKSETCARECPRSCHPGSENSPRRELTPRCVIPSLTGISQTTVGSQMKTIFHVLFFAGLVCGSETRVFASVIAYEGFDYAPNANGLNSQSGGAGWSSNWGAGNSAVVSGGFDYTDSVRNQLIT